MKNNSFGKSFYYAWQGIWHAFRYERNIKFHTFAALAALGLAYAVGLSRIETALLAAAIAGVFVTELFNTAVERTVDLISPDFHPLAKIAKDVAAGAVLVASIFAAVTGYLLFFDKIFRY